MPKSNTVYHIINLIGTLLCGFVLAACGTTIFVLKDLSRNCELDPSCEASFLRLLQEMVKSPEAWMIIGAFLLAYILVFIASSRYFTIFGGLFIGLLGTIFASIFLAVYAGITISQNGGSSGIGSVSQRTGTATLFFLIGSFILSMIVMFLTTTVPSLIYWQIKKSRLN